MLKNSALVLAMVTVTACQAQGLDTVARAPMTHSSQAPTSGAIASTPASTPPSHTPSLAPSASPMTPAPSSGPTTNVSGLIELNPAYIVSAGGGNIVSAGGGNIISAGGGNLISAGGGNLISAGGGNLISAGGGNYRVLDTSSTDASASPELPASGVLVAAVSLTTHQLLAPAVYTDQTGHYTLQVPQSLKGNFAVIAGFPAKSATDPVLQNPALSFSLVANADTQGAAPVLNEDANGLTYYLRRCMRPYLEPMLFGDVDAASASLVKDWGLPDIYAGQVSVVGQRLRSDLQAASAKYHLTTTAQQAVFVQGIIDDLIAGLGDPKTIPINPLLGYTGSQTSAASALQGALAFLRQKADEKLASDPTFFEHADFTANAGNDPDTQAPYQFRNGADLERFIVKAYLTRGNVDVTASDTVGPLTATTNVLDELVASGTATVPNEYALEMNDLRAASLSYMVAILMRFQEEDDPNAILPPIATGATVMLP